MLGTTPLMSHVPAKDPINNKIKMAGAVVEMLLPIPASILDQLIPFLTPMSAPRAAANKRAIWLAPSNEALPYKTTLMVSKTIKHRMGIKALKSVECFM